MDRRGVLSLFYLPFSAKNRVGAPQPGCQALHPFTDVFIQQASARGCSALGEYPQDWRHGNGCCGVQAEQLDAEFPGNTHFPWSQQLGFRILAPAQLHTRLGPVNTIS
uniref:Uncharacterized protein n=1 Tax=Saimiri boliviensis boliviensis TaxID=39432 RepID=A0A2K6T3G5_SAIBB